MTVILVILAVLMADPAPPPASPSDDWKAAAEALDQAADEVVGRMSPDERAQFEGNVERSATSEMQAAAKRCGTALAFSKEPRFEDRTVWTSPDASADQTACVQRVYPFVKVAPE